MKIVSEIDYAKLSNSERLDLAKTFVRSFRTSLPQMIDARSFTLKSRLPYHAAIYRAVLIHRVCDLAEVALDLYDAERFVPAFIQVRAVIETTAMVHLLHKRVSEFLRTGDEDVLHDFLKRGMVGRKTSTADIPPHQILTAVDHLDKRFTGLREMYDALSEFVHPNWDGVLGAYSGLDTENHLLSLGSAHSDLPLNIALDPFVLSLAIFQDYYNSLGDIVLALNERYGSA